MLIDLPRAQLARTTFPVSALTLPRNERTYLEIRYALPYQPISAIEWNSAVILGIAVTTIDESNVMRYPTSITENKVMYSLNPTRVSSIDTGGAGASIVRLAAGLGVSDLFSGSMVDAVVALHLKGVSERRQLESAIEYRI